MTSIKVLNLKCGGCANTIKKGVLSVEGVNHVEVDVETSNVTFEAASEETISKVKEKLSKLGYPEEGDANTMLHKAKSYVSCATGKMSQE